MSRFYAPVVLVLVLLLTVAVYVPGMTADFIFDDFPTLEDMGSLGGVTNWETFKGFVFGGIAGPLGRPIALASFLIDSNNWPAEPASFIRTNIAIHLLAGLALSWAMLNFLKNLYPDDLSLDKSLLAVLGAGFWLLHPYMVSTTLYVVQRMAELSALFMFGGLAGYWHGRLHLRDRPVYGVIVCALSVFIGTFLAVFSKENGVLLPVLLLASELYLPSIRFRYSRWLVLILLVVPALAICIYLFKYLSVFNDVSWSNRPFTQHERILTQPRIVLDYLWQLLVPRIEGRGLFQDGYEFSKSILHPLSTLVALCLLILLLVAAFVMRRRYPIVGYGLAFYFLSHLTESTWINLELYFEHRSYSASGFLFLSLAYFLLWLNKRFKSAVGFFLCFLILSVLSLLTYQRASLWGNSVKLQFYWAVASPNSARAQNYIASTYYNLGNPVKALEHYEESHKKMPLSSLLTVNLLLMKVYMNVAEKNDFVEAGQQMKLQPMDAQSVMGMRSLVEKVTGDRASAEYAYYTSEFLDYVRENSSYNNNSVFLRLYWYLKGNLYLYCRMFEQASTAYSNAIDAYGDVEAALSMVAEMGNHERPAEALILLDKAVVILNKRADKSLKRSRKSYEDDIAWMRQSLSLQVKEGIIDNRPVRVEK